MQKIVNIALTWLVLGGGGQGQGRSEGGGNGIFWVVKHPGAGLSTFFFHRKCFRAFSFLLSVKKRITNINFSKN